VSGATTQVGSGPHAVRKERCALVMLSYCTWKIVSSRNQRYLHVDAGDGIVPEYLFFEELELTITRF
jgi:hypothetical protein